MKASSHYAIATRASQPHRRGQKVTGAATYAYEYPVEGVTYVFPVQSTIAKGRVELDRRECRACAARCHRRALARERPAAAAPPGTTRIWRSSSRMPSAYRGQFVAAVVAETLETARQAAAWLPCGMRNSRTTSSSRVDRGDLYTPESCCNAGYASGQRSTATSRRRWRPRRSHSTTPTRRRPSTTIPWSRTATICVTWQRRERDRLRHVPRGLHRRRDDDRRAFGLPPERVRVISPYVGGGFGSKGFTHPLILAALASQAVRRPAKLAQTRQQMFALAGHRSPTIQRYVGQPGATAGSSAIAHDVVEQSSTRSRR